MGLNRADLSYHHSHYIIGYGDGKEDFETNRACYSGLWNGVRGMEYLKLVFPDHRNPAIGAYVQWLLNSDLFGEAFLTKDWEEGINNGFEIDIHQPTNFLFSAMAAIRFPWESEEQDGTWSWGDYRELGFSERQSLFLSINAVVIAGELVEASYNSNHLPMPRLLSFNKYYPQHFRRQNGTMYQCSSSMGVSECWGYGDSGAFLADWLSGKGFKTVGNNTGRWGSRCRKFDLNSDLVNFLKNELKEE